MGDRNSQTAADRMDMMSSEDFLKTFPPEDSFPVEGFPARDLPPSGVPATRIGRFAASHGLTLRDIFRLFFKHKWAILIPLVLATGLGTAYTLVATPWYQATATVQIQPNELASLAPTVNLERQKNLLNDQVQVLRSDTMLERVVEVLRLDTRMASLLGEEIPSADRVTGAIRILKENILSIQPVQDANFITIMAMLPNADLAATIPNTLAEEYVNAVQQRIATRATELSGRYDEEAQKLQVELEKVDVKISKFLSDNGIPDMIQRFESLRAQTDRVDNDLREAKRDEGKLTSEIKAFEDQLAKEPATIASTTQTTSNPQYIQLKQYLDQLQLQRTSLAGTWKEGSKRIQALDLQIEEAKKNLEELDPESVTAKVSMSNPRHDQILDDLVRLRPLLEATQQDIKTLTEAQKEIADQMANFASIRQGYIDMMGEKVRIQSQLDFAKERARTAQTTGKFATEIAEVKISDQARKPLGPSGPNHVLHIFLSVMMGLGVGIGFSILREILNHTIETTSDVQKHLGVAVLGTIPEKAFAKR
jgi:uncharacterized protein involved in exopolysaccharide biosynthesis